MNKTPLLLILYVITGQAVASNIYKCDIDGVSTYSQQPCDENLTPIIIEQKSFGNSKIKPEGISASSKTAIRQLDEVQAYQIGQEIKRNDQTSLRYKKKMSKEIEVLKNKMYSENNNMAGAIYQESISKKMIAVANKYSTLINELKIKNTKLRDRQLALK